MKQIKSVVAALLGLLLPACMQHDPWADRSSGQVGGFSRGHDYEFYQPSLTQIARMRTAPPSFADDPNRPVTVSDADVVTFADHAKGILRSKFTNSRLARYFSSATQVALIAAVGIAGVTNAGATTIAALTLATTVPPELSDIFHAKERASAYQAAAAHIETAEAKFLAARAKAKTGENIPSDRKLTEDGTTLYAEVTTQIEGAEAVVQGQLPSVMAALPTPAAASPSPSP